MQRINHAHGHKQVRTGFPPWQWLRFDAPVAVFCMLSFGGSGPEGCCTAEKCAQNDDCAMRTVDFYHETQTQVSRAPLMVSDPYASVSCRAQCSLCLQEAGHGVCHGEATATTQILAHLTHRHTEPSCNRLTQVGIIAQAWSVRDSSTFRAYILRQVNTVLVKNCSLLFKALPSEGVMSRASKDSIMASSSSAWCQQPTSTPRHTVVEWPCSRCGARLGHSFVGLWSVSKKDVPS